MHTYIEDAFVELVNVSIATDFMSQDDFNICYSFYTAIITSKLLTQNQRNFLLILMEKYHAHAEIQGVIYPKSITPLVWKNAVRIIDTTRKIWIQVDDTDCFSWIFMRFPYALKLEFDEAIKQEYTSEQVRWDPDVKCWKVYLYHYNLFAINEFAITHNFQIDDSFAKVYADYEEYHNNEMSFISYCEVVDNNVILMNSTLETNTWWENNSTGILHEDLFLAKSMGYYYNGPPGTTTIEKIAATSATNFWINSTELFLNLCYDIPGRIAIVLDRTSDEVVWLTQFIEVVDRLHISHDDIKVHTKGGRKLNAETVKLVADNNICGTNESKISIFLHKPPKWIFKNNIVFSMVATNGLYPQTVGMTRHWISSHSCVIHLGSIRPSHSKDIKIVEL